MTLGEASEVDNASSLKAEHEKDIRMTNLPDNQKHGKILKPTAKHKI